jgi:SAM-dependent methyltransferase
MRAYLADLLRRATGTAALSRQLAALREELAARPGGPAPETGIRDHLSAVNHTLHSELKDAARVRELQYRDIMLAMDRLAEIFPRGVMTFETEKPVALDTADHLHPWGAAQDNTRSPRFVAACERHFPGRRLAALDLGCSGGGLVLDFLLRGHEAWGIEGSDHPLRSQRAEWRVLRNNLFTADITRPFRLRAAPGAGPVSCQVITMWEVMEHIAEEDQPALFDNIRAHLAPDGIFVGSVSLVPDEGPDGAQYHRTVQDRAWWEARFAQLGLPLWHGHDFAHLDFCRGTGNGPMDIDYRDRPDMGFHFVARRA